jgi:hypothetical protein
MAIAKKHISQGLGALCFALLSLALTVGSAPSAHAQALGWEGETGIFVTPLAYTSPVAAGKTFGKPLIAFHYMGGGNVAGNFFNMSVTEGIKNRFEFGYTRQVHAAGGAKPYGYATDNEGNPVAVPGTDPNAWAATFFGDGLNTFHGKVLISKENTKKWYRPALSAGAIIHTNVNNNACGVTLPDGKGGTTNLCAALGHPGLKHSTTNEDFYVVASKLILKSLPAPILISGGVRGTNDVVFSMVGNSATWAVRGFGSAAIVFSGPGKSQVIFGSEVSGNPTNPQYLDGKKNELFPNGGGPNYVLPTTLTYALRVIPNPKHKFNMDFGYAEAAGWVGPTHVAGYPAQLNLECRRQIGVGVTYGF